jgi:hypothetical protein
MKKKFKHKAYGYCALHGMGSCKHVQAQSKLEMSPEFKNRFKKQLFKVVLAGNKLLSEMVKQK